MRSGRLVAALLAALVLSALPIQAQQGDLSLSVEPPILDIVAGTQNATTLVLTNHQLRAYIVRLSAEETALGVGFERVNVSMLPGATERVRVTIEAPQNASGNLTVRFLAKEDASAAPGVGPVSAEASLLVRVRPPPERNGSRDDASIMPIEDDDPEGDPGPPAPVAPLLSPSRIEHNASAPGVPERSVQVTNPANFSQTFPVRLWLPAGWSGGVDPSNLTLGPEETGAFTLFLHAEAGAPDGMGRVEVGPAGATANVTLLLEGAPAAPGGEDPAPPKEEPRDTPPSGSEPSPQPPTAPTQSEPPQEEGAAPMTPPEPFRPPPRISVWPATLRVAPGAEATALVRVEAPAEADWEGSLELRLPPGFEASLHRGRIRVAAGETGELEVRVRADAQLAWGSHSSGAITASPMGEASFDLLVVAPPPEPAAVPPPAEQPLALVLVFGATGAAAILVMKAHRRWPLLFAALYARLSPRQLREHPQRVRILEAVAREAGLTLGELQRRLGLANGALAYHVRRLEKENLLVLVPDGQQRRLHLPGAPRPAPVPPLPERIVTLLQREGAMAASDVARILGVSRQALHHHLRALEAQGLVATDREGLRLRVRVVAAPALVGAQGPGRK